MKKVKKYRRILPVLFWAVYLAGWLMAGFANYIIDRAGTPVTLDVSQAYRENLAEIAPDVYVSENADPQLQFLNMDTKARAVLLKGEFSSLPGGMELFYSKNPEGGFSVNKRVFGVPMGDGVYLYRFPQTKLGSLRLDPGMVGANEMKIEEITINPHLPAGYYLVPNLRDVIGFLFTPALALVCFYTIIECILALRNRLRSRKEVKV